MTIWTAEIKELEKLNEPISGRLHGLEKEMGQLLKTGDENVAMLYSRRCLEIIVTDLCETELKRARKTEPLKGIIDKLHKEEKVPSYIITSMHGLNTLSTYGAHPKDFDPEQVKPALSNLAIVLKWYLRYRGIEIPVIPSSMDEDAETVEKRHLTDPAKLEKSIAVLPFINDSPDQENTYFINGALEEILNNLQKIKDLRVISRTSAEQYRDQKRPISEIAQELGVNYIVEGSGQKYGNSFRLRAQLIKAEHESHLWGESFQNEINDVKDIFSIQIQIAESMAAKLKAIITPVEKKLIEKIPTADLTAYDAYLKGKFYAYNATPDDINLNTAMEVFELAKERDPEFALAYAGMANIWMFRQQMGLTSPDEAGQKIMENVERALELDSTLAEVHYMLANNDFLVTWNWEAAESAYKKVIEINPNHPEAHALYSHLLIVLGRPEEAFEHAELSLKLDPHNPWIIIWYTADLLSVHRYDECISLCREFYEKNPTTYWPLMISLYIALHMKEKYEEAFKALKLAMSIQYKDFDHVFDQYEKLGYVDTLNLEADTLLEQSKTKYLSQTDIASIYSLAANKVGALDCLEQAYEMHDPVVPYIGVFPNYAILHDEPRYQEIMRKLSLPLPKSD
jgi:TolB-like protein